MGTRAVRSGTFVSFAAVLALVLGMPAGALGLSFTVVSGAAPPGGTLAGVSVLAPNDVWAVGGFRPTGPGYNNVGLEPFAEHFNGSTWTQVPVAGTRFNDDTLAAVAGSSSTDVWAVGARKRTGFKSPVTTLAEHWNGTAWTEVPTPVINGTRYSFAAASAVSGNDVWAVGSAAAAPSTGLNALAEHWNGSAWSIVPVPLPAGTAGSTLLGVSARASNDVWAVGNANGRTLVVHWNGSVWTVVTSQDVPPQRPGATVADTLNAVRVVAANDVWAVGSATDTVSGSFLPNRTVIEHWNGTQWTLLASPTTFGHPQLTGVASAAANDVWAVGSGWNDVTTGVPVASPIYLHFDGSRWTSIAPPPNVGGGDNLVNAVSALPSGDTWAVGTSPGAPLIERRS